MSKVNWFSRAAISKVIISSLLLLTTACSGRGLSLNKEPPALPEAFSAQIDFAIGGLDGSALLTQTDGTLELSFQQPDTLSGLSACLTDGDVSLSFGDVTAFVGESLPDGALITVLADAFTLSRTPETVTTASGTECWIFAGALPDTAGDFQLTVSSDGLPTALIAEKAGITVLFTQAELIY